MFKKMYNIFLFFCLVIAVSGEVLDDEEEPIREVNWTIEPGKPKIVTNPGYDIPMVGEGNIRYQFTVKDGFGILASCDDDYRPSPHFENPCETFTITFDDGAYRKQFCSFYWLTETYYMTNRSKLSFQMNYTEGGSSIVRCVFRTTEPLPKRTNKILVPKESELISPNRTSFSEDYYEIESENGKPFNIDCRFSDTESSYCILSRVIMKVGNEEMFCLSRDFRRKNIKKAEMRVWSDRNGWPEIRCKFTTGTTGNPNTPKMPPYGKKSRRLSIERKEERKSLKLDAGETVPLVAKLNATNVLILDISVPETSQIYVFCNVFKPEIDGSLPCDPFEMRMEETNRIPVSWCSRRHLESLGYLSDGPNLKLTMENFSKRNKVICAVRSTEPPKATEKKSVSKESPTYNIEISKNKKESEYMIQRWVINHPDGGTLTVKCDHNILRAIYHNKQGVGIIKRQYYCYQRRIQVNDDVKCEEPVPVTKQPIEFEASGTADVVIMTDKDGLSGHLCSVTGEF